MTVQNVSQVRNANFKGNEINSKDTNTTQPKNSIINGKKKLILALAALGAATVAGVAIYNGRHKTLDKTTQEAKKAIKKASSIQGLTKKDDLPFDSTITTILAPDKSKFAIKSTYNKYGAEYKGREVIVEHKNIFSRNLHGVGENFAVIRDAKTNELIEIKPVTLKGDERPLVQMPVGSKVKLKKTEKIFDKNKKELAKKTVVNGKTKAITTTVKNPDGSKTITVNYGRNGQGFDFDTEFDYKKVITINPDGKKSVKTVGNSVYES